MSEVNENNYVAAMVLAGVGDAMGYKCGQWEFNFVGENIHKEVRKLGGVEKLNIQIPDFIVSDDTVLLLSTADSLIEVGAKGYVGSKYYSSLYKEIAFRYQKDVIGDMSGRAAGNGTQVAIHQLRPNISYGWHIPFNVRGGGCGAAMRAMCIGLCYPNVYNKSCLEDLVRISIESGRITHNHPTGYLGSLATALFGAFAISGVPLRSWGSYLIQLLPHVWRYIEKAERDVKENEKNWEYFQAEWTKYLSLRNLETGLTEAIFPENYGVKERDAFYKSVSFSGWGGSSGHDAPMIAYDALLAAGGDWKKLCHHGMLHGGDNDSSGVIAGFCYGAMYEFKDVSILNHQKVEKRKRLEDAGKALFKLAKPFVDNISNGGQDLESCFSSLFDNDSFIYP